MSSTFPTTLDSFTDPTATSKLNSPDHAAQHANKNDALEKIEAKVGVDGSAVTTTHDYKLSGVATGDKAASLTAEETLLLKTLTTPVVASVYQDAAKTKLLTVPDTASDTLAALAATQTFTNKRITKRVGTEASSATSTPTADSVDMWTVTALAAADVIAAPTGTPTDGQTLLMRIKDNGTARALSFNAIYRFSSDLAAPTTTVLGKTLYLGFIYNSADSKWDCIAKLDNF